MKPDKIRQVQAEIQVVANRHGLRHWAFCGEDKSRNFVGFAEEKKTQGAYVLTILNIGRLWQYGRQMCRAVLDSYEKLP